MTNLTKSVLKTALVFALVATFAISMAACTGGGGKTLNSAEELKAYLDKQPVNSPDKPIRVSMSANGPMLPKIAEAINSSAKYVSLNLTGNALTTIPDDAFYQYRGEGIYKGCETLVSITIPDCVTSIGEHAFDSCSSLASITIPASVTSIGARAFSDCTSLASIIIPDSVTSIGNWAFDRCNSLASITVTETITSNEFDPYDFPGDFWAKYLAGGPGTYTRVSSWTTWTKQGEKALEFPVGFIGTWKRNNFNNTLTFTADSLKASNQSVFWRLMSISGDSYTFYLNASHIASITIKLINGNLVISGDSGTDEDNWNGTWIKQ